MREDESSLKAGLYEGTPKASSHLNSSNLLWLMAGTMVIIASSYLEKLKHEPFVQWFGEDTAKSTVGVVHVFGNIVHEIGFAILVAVFVGILIEQGHRAGITNILNTKIDSFMNDLRDENLRSKDDINRAAFSAVFKKTLPDFYVDRVLETNFDVGVIRSDFEIEYVFEELPEGAKEKVDSDHILITAKLKFVSENISPRPVMLRRALGLPNPHNRALQSLTKVLASKAGRTKYTMEDNSIEDMDSGNKSLQDCFNEGANTGHFETSELMVESGASLYQELSYQLVKEAEDAEMFRIRVPTNGMKIRVIDKTDGRSLLIGGEVIHSDKFTSSSVGDQRETVKTFELVNWLLPHQGIIIFWKNVDQSLGG